jgi:hypothetical protein
MLAKVRESKLSEIMLILRMGLCPWGAFDSLFTTDGGLRHPVSDSNGKPSGLLTPAVT